MEEGLVLHNRLAAVRKEKGLSQAELAKMVGVSRNTVSSIETGQFNPTAKLAVNQLSKLSGCEMHCSHLPTPGDEVGLRKLGINLTCDPIFASRDLFVD